MGRKLPVFLAEGEPEKLMAAATRERDRLLILIGLTLGLRVSEMTKLCVEDIDFRRRTLFCRAAKGDKDRCLPIPKVLYGPLRGWIGKRQSGYVFPSPRGGRLTSRAIQKLLKRLALKAGLRDALAPRRVNPHKLRHAAASRILAAGASIYEVSQILGHASIGTTQTYLWCDMRALEDAVNRVYEG